MKILTSILTAFILIGCSGLPSQQRELAQNNEWWQLGLLDGQIGHYQQAKPELQKLNELSDNAFEEYKLGYLEGIEQFCVPNQTYEHGLKGQAYRGQCANTKQEDLAVQRWLEGYRRYVVAEEYFIRLEN